MFDQQFLDQARSLVEQIEAGNTGEVKKLLDDLAKVREADLFQELGKLTRELHDTLNNFRIDSRISEYAEREIPDAKERLNYVISMTEQAANKTLTAVEDALPVSEKMTERSASLHQRWQQFRDRELSVEEFRVLSRELDEFFPSLREDAELVRRNLSDVLMAQDFQDLTGQIIRRVIELVKDVEKSLVEMIRISGTGGGKNGSAVAGATRDDDQGHGPSVPGVDADAVMQGQDDVDELLSSLGF